MVLLDFIYLTLLELLNSGSFMRENLEIHENWAGKSPEV